MPIDVLKAYRRLKAITGMNFLPDIVKIGYNKNQKQEHKMKQLPQYKCHKIVRAAKIKEVADTADFGAFLHFEDDLDSIQVNSDYIGKHKPQAGGYYVIYNDGYESFSPSKAFEKGYELIKKGN